jgi:hypothetical protein
MHTGWWQRVAWSTDDVMTAQRVMTHLTLGWNLPPALTAVVSGTATFVSSPPANVNVLHTQLPVAVVAVIMNGAGYAHRHAPHFPTDPS